MSRARQARRLARSWARLLGAAAGEEHARDFAVGGPCGDAPGRDELLDTARVTFTGRWVAAAMGAEAARRDRCPGGYELTYYLAYAASARATVLNWMF